MSKRKRWLLIVCIFLTAFIATYTWRASMSWSHFPRSVKGVEVEGDAKASPTRWYNRWYLALWGWQTVVVLEVDADKAKAGYNVGYKDAFGRTEVENKDVTDPRFRMKVGHETCIFFAADRLGNEIPLKVIAKTTKDDPAYKDAPLH